MKALDEYMEVKNGFVNVYPAKAGKQRYGVTCDSHEESITRANPCRNPIARIHVKLKERINHDAN